MVISTGSNHSAVQNLCIGLQTAFFQKFRYGYLDYLFDLYPVADKQIRPWYYTDERRYDEILGCRHLVIQFAQHLDILRIEAYLLTAFPQSGIEKIPVRIFTTSPGE